LTLFGSLIAQIKSGLFAILLAGHAEFCRAEQLIRTINAYRPYD
jgi:hypothetical protein